MKLVRNSWLAIFAFLLTTLTSPSAFADTVNILWGAHHSSNAGAYIATPSGGVLGTTPFLTFCIETDEFLNIGGTYNYQISNAANLGGSGGPSPDPLSIGTAWLYSQFRDGLLNFDVNNNNDHTALQQAFWWLEQESSSFVISNPDGNKYLDTAKAHFGGVYAGLRTDAGANNYGVVILNLTDNSGNVKQDVLARVPEPSATLLLSICLVGIGWFAHRKKLLQPGHLSHS